MNNKVHMKSTGEEIYRIAEQIFPICRSITGEGVRETLNILAKYVNGMKICNVTGCSCAARENQ